MKASQILLGLLRIPTDFIMGLLAFWLAYLIRSKTDLLPGISLPLDLESFPNMTDYINFSAISIAILLVLFVINGMYSLRFRIKTGKEMGKILVLGAAWLMIIIAYFFIRREFPFSRLVLAYSWILTIMLICLGRIMIRFMENILYHMGIGKKNILFIGANAVTEKIAANYKKNPQLFIAGVIDTHLQKITSLRTLGKVGELEKIVKKYRIEEIVQTKSDLSENESTGIVEFCRGHQLEYSFVPDILGIYQTNVEVELTQGIPVIKLKPTPLDGWGRVAKRAFDLLGAILGFIVLSPIFIITSITIKIDSKGDILFKKLDNGERVKRVGQHGKLFNFYKFRTMYPNTHNLRYTELAGQNTRDGSPLVKIKNDPRVTRLGGFLRKTSIDELPQLINVLKGNMSLVGPRPHLPEEVAKYDKHHKFVLTIKPGITGMAQISGRSDLNFEQEVQLDTYYIEHWSIWLDIKILFKTLGVVFKGYSE
jgi:exopolysaccharide biosynthesis polyprenyl glycosylphosphotransferase